MKNMVVKAKWKQIEALIKGKWAKLNDNDLDAIKEDINLLAAKVEERYGLGKEEIEKQVKDLLKDIL